MLCNSARRKVVTFNTMLSFAAKAHLHSSLSLCELLLDKKTSPPELPFLRLKQAVQARGKSKCKVLLDSIEQLAKSPRTLTGERQLQECSHQAGS
jgi:hypothetical protein